MRHLAALAVALVCLLATGAALNALAARSDATGLVWVWVRGPAGPALNGLVQGGGARVAGTWAGGRLVQLRVDSTRDAARQARAWAVLRLPDQAWGWPACG